MAHAMVSSRKKWESFFLDSGIPQRQAVEYAATFYNNRMRLDMLDELTKDVLRDLGIKALGDIIMILRHAKLRQFTGNRSPSPDGVSVISTEKVKSSISNPTGVRSSSANVKSVNKIVPQKVNIVKNKATKNISPNKSKPVSTSTISVNPTKNSAKPMNTANSSKPMNTAKRLKLSERFDEIDTEAKHKKVGGKVEEAISASDANSKTPLSSKPVQFTVQVPAKLPATVQLPVKPPAAVQAPAKPPATVKITSDRLKAPPKVTVVPARGKALNRSRHLTSIFDRLDAPSSSSVAVELLNDELSNPKNNVFKRLGGKPNQPDDDSEVATDIVPVVLDAKHKAESVFRRLGVINVDNI